MKKTIGKTTKEEVIELPEEELDRYVKFLKENGYKYGTLRGSGNCRVSLYSKEDGYQILFMATSVQIVDLNENKRYKVSYSSGDFGWNSKGEIEFNLTPSMEIQL